MKIDIIAAEIIISFNIYLLEDVGISIQWYGADIANGATEAVRYCL